MNKFWKVLTGCAVAVALMPLAACDNEDYSSSPDRPDYNVNYVYLYEPVEAYSTIDFKATGDFLSTLDNPLALCPVHCTKPAPEDMVVKVSIDSSLVSAYNTANKTDYAFMDGVRLTNDVFTIKKGTYLSEEMITMDVYDRQSLQTSAKDLILPIKIENVSGGGSISEGHGAVYIHFVYQANFVQVASVYEVKLQADDSPWTSQLANLAATDVVTAKWAADETITLEAEIDGNLVSSFVQNYGDSDFTYEFMDGTTLKSPITVEKGATKGGIKLNAGNHSKLADGVRYVIPVKVSGINGKGAALAADEYVCYVVVYVAPPTLSLGTPAGSLISYNSADGWTMKVNGSEMSNYGDDWSYLFTAYDYVAPWANGDVIEIDLQQTYELTGLKLSFYAWYYALNGFTEFKTSTDGQNWTTWDAEFTWPGDDSQNLTFDSPTQVRYINCVVGSGSYYSNIYCTGFQFYQK